MFNIHLSSTQEMLSALPVRAQLELANTLAIPFEATDQRSNITVAIHAGEITAWTCRVVLGETVDVRVASIRGHLHTAIDDTQATRLMSLVSACGAPHTYRWNATAKRWGRADY